MSKIIYTHTDEAPLSLPENKGRTGFLVMEEFAMLGRNNSAFCDFAIDFSETMRKRGCWLITLTPRPQNYFQLEIGQAFWGVADNFIFLKMNPDNVDYIVKNSTLLNASSAEIVKNLNTIKGERAEIFYSNKSGTIQGQFKFSQIPIQKWLSPTNAQDQLLVDKAIERYPKDMWAALNYLLENHS